MIVLFFFIWILLNGKITLQVVISGVIVTAAVFLFVCKFMRHSIGREKAIYKRLIYSAKYVIILIAEIFKASFAVLPFIYGRRNPKAVVVHFKMDDIKTDGGRVMLADSITRTPGTVTASLKDGDYLVHCLDSSMAKGLDSSDIVNVIKEWEGNHESH